MPPTAGSLGNQKKVSDLLELPNEGAGNQTQVFCKNSACSQLHSLSPAPTSQVSVAGTFGIHSSRNFEIWLTVLSSTLDGNSHFSELWLCIHWSLCPILSWPCPPSFGYLCSTLVKSAFKGPLQSLVFPLVQPLRHGHLTSELGSRANNIGDVLEAWTWGWGWARFSTWLNGTSWTHSVPDGGNDVSLS